MEHGLEKFGITERRNLHAYFIAMANIFEPERSIERLAWAKSRILVEVIRACFGKDRFSLKQKRKFVEDFLSKSGGLTQPDRYIIPWKNLPQKVI